jgi:hypothetical protein
MGGDLPRCRIHCRALISTLALLPALAGPFASGLASAETRAPNDTLPSWKEGSAKQAILDFVRETTDPADRKFVPPEERIASFDQDGTLWVEHPVYGQMMYCLDRVPALVARKPALKNVEPFKTVLSGSAERIGNLPMRDLEKIIVATLTGMTTDEFVVEVKNWLATAKDPRWNRPYTDLIYQPMLEVLSYLRANGFKTYMSLGSGRILFVSIQSNSMESRPSRWSDRRWPSSMATRKTGDRFLPRCPSSC